MKNFILPVLLILFSCNSSQNPNYSNIFNSKKSTKIALKILDSLHFKRNSAIFDVDNVELAPNLLKTKASKIIFEERIGKEILFFPNEHKNHKLITVYNNCLIETLLECYDNHRPLILSPDIIWLTICQGVSVHLNLKMDSLENHIFNENKPKELVIRNDYLHLDSKNSKHWLDLISSFADTTKSFTNDDYYSFFVPKFSTTSQIQTTAYQVNMLNSFQSVFNYTGVSGCGIPKITLKGKKSDWMRIYLQLEFLKEFGLGFWGENLKPIIAEFVNVYDNKINKEFWNEIFKNHRFYSFNYISGWFIKFFPYVYPSNFSPNPYLEGESYLISKLETKSFPSDFSKIDIKWKNEFKKITQEIEVYSGFLGINQHSDKSLEPLISWSICNKNANKVEKPIFNIFKIGDSLKHNKFKFWDPEYDRYETKPIYNSSKFDLNSSRDFLKNYLERELKSKYNNIDSTIKIAIIISSNGNFVKLKIEKNDKYLTFLQEKIKQLPEKWTPGSSFIPFADHKDSTIKVNVNSQLIINLFE